jgi:hypothetical protein
MDKKELVKIISKYRDVLPFDCDVTEIIDSEMDVDTYCAWSLYLHELKKHDKIINFRNQSQRGWSRIIYKYNDDIRYDHNIVDHRRNYMILSETTTYFAGYW